jgi:Glutathione S-transferase, N-terminal domain
MTKPEIIGSARSTYTRVVRMVCEEKGIDYALKETPLGSPELRAIHPLGKMPVLRHGHVELFESKRSPPISTAALQAPLSSRSIRVLRRSSSNGFRSSTP